MVVIADLGEMFWYIVFLGVVAYFNTVDRTMVRCGVFAEFGGHKRCSLIVG